jgi:toxin FitB
MREMKGFLKSINTNVESDEESALAVIAHIQQGQVIPLDSELTIDAGNVGVVHKLPLASSIVFATAQKYAATVWTQDADFNGLPNIKYFTTKST